MILSFRALWSLSARRGAFPAFPRSVGSRTGAVPLRIGLSVTPRFLWECLTSLSVSPSPVPARSNAACGFPALRFPVTFTSRVM
jgi:hypothetical protein